MRRLVFLLLLCVLLLPSMGYAQSNGGAICVFAYNDVNQNAELDADESALPGVAVHLANENNVILYSHVTTDSPDRHCFDNLPNAVYVLTFADSANHQAISGNSSQVVIDQAQRYRIDFGAIPDNAILVAGSEDAQAQAEANAGGSLDVVSRLLLAAFGAVLVMVLMLGLGLVFGTLFIR